MSAVEGNEIYVVHDDIDEDIQRLKIVLGDEEREQEVESEGELQVLDKADDVTYNPASRPSTSSDVTASSFPTTSMGTEADDFVIRFDPSSINAESCLDMNRAYQEVLLDTLRQIEMALNENRARQKELSESLEEKCTKGVKAVATKVKPLTEYAAPFFRDSSGNAAPSNPDVQLKAAMQEGKQLVRPKPGWSKPERKRLLNAVRLDALEQQIRPIMNKLEVATEKMGKCKTTEDIEVGKGKIATLKEEIQEKQKLGSDVLLENVDISKIDFMKISAIEFKGKYNSSECESMWRNVLRPGINRDRWTHEEETRLNEIAANHHTRNWKTIAEELGTKRTPFQCLQHFQKNNYVFDTREWTSEEDELLKEVVDTCQYGTSKIQWHQVAYYMECRSAVQCRIRWQRISPYIKHGHWMKEEDLLLTAAVQMVGDNDWLRVQEFVTFRNAQQCRERWQNCLDPNLKLGQWTYEEDKLLLKLFEKYKRVWTAIASQLPGRTDQMCMKRHQVLMKWKETSEIFNGEPIEVKKDLMSPFFEMNADGQIYPKADTLPKKPPLRKKRQVRRWQQWKYDGDYGSEEEGVEEDKWEKFAREQQLEPSDYLKQARDAENNEMVVPRPPPLRKYTIRAYSKTWSRRKTIQKIVQACVNTAAEKRGIAEPKDAVNNVAALGKIMNIDEADKEKMDLISYALRGYMPHQLNVSTLLEISRSIKQFGKIPDHLLKDEDEESEDEYNEMMEEMEKRDTNSEKESEESEDELEEEPEPVPPKPKRELTEAEKERYKLRKIKMAEHREVHQQIRNVIRSRMGMTQFKRRQPGRQRVYNLYPNSKILSEPGDLARISNKSLAILMKSFDVDSRAVYKKAKLLKRNQSAVALLKSVNCRRSKRQQASKSFKAFVTRSEETETADLILDLKNELGIEDSEDNMEMGDQEIKIEEGVEQDENVNDGQQLMKLTGTVSNDGMIGGSYRKEGGTYQALNGTSHSNIGIYQEQSRTSQCVSGTSQYVSETSQYASHTSLVNTKQKGQSFDSYVPGLANVSKSLDSESQNLSTDNVEAKRVDNDNVRECQSASVDGESAPDSYDKILPYIPPNLSNLQAMKCLLLEHRSLISMAGGFFDKEELKEHLYRIKNKGSNPLLPVFMTVSSFKNPRQIRSDSTAKATNRSKRNPKQIVVQNVRKTRSYQLLKARFQSLFVWPAFISTVFRPRLKDPKPTPAEPCSKGDIEVGNVDNYVDKNDTPDKGMVIRNEKVEKDIGENAEEEDTEMVTSETYSEGDPEDEVVKENVARAVEEVMEAEGQDLTQEEAIEKLVEKILMEYKASRESKKSYIRKSRRKLTQGARQATFQRERTKILKRLGLWEKMEEFRRQREEQQAHPDSEQTIFIPAENVLDIQEISQNDTNTLSSSLEQEQTKRKGRPVGTKNFMNVQCDNVRKSGRSREIPTTLTDSIITPDKRPTRKRAYKLTRLKELIPVKMSKLASQIQDMPLLKGVEAEQNTKTDVTCRGSKRKAPRKPAKSSKKCAVRSQTNPCVVEMVEVEQRKKSDGANTGNSSEGAQNALEKTDTQCIEVEIGLNESNDNDKNLDTVADPNEDNDTEGKPNNTLDEAKEQTETNGISPVANENDQTNTVSCVPSCNKNTNMLPQLTPEVETSGVSVSGNLVEGVVTTLGTSALQETNVGDGGFLPGNPARTAFPQIQQVMMAIPVQVGDQQQIACVPVQVGQDGKVILPVQSSSGQDSNVLTLNQNESN